MKKNIIFITLLFLFIAPSVYSQEVENITTQTDSEIEETAGAESSEENKDNVEKKKSVFDQFEIIAQFEPTLYLSPDSLKNKSNVVNIVYPIAIGALWPKNYWIGFQPTISFFTMPVLWHDDMALPAEIENRTATALSAFINLPAVFTFNLPNSKMHLSAGVGVMARYGFLSVGVNKGDPGYKGNTAEQDVKLINKWFWENGHWFYFTVGTSWLYPISSRFQIGPVLNAYIPLGTLIDQKDVQGLMISIGVKLCI